MKYTKQIESNINSKGFSTLVIIGVVIVVLVGVMAYVVIPKKSSQPVSQQQVVEKTPEIATDPFFKEAKGQILPGAPDVPVYPGATLVGSSETSPEGQPVQGYRIKWKTSDSVKQVMAYYEIELPKAAWNYEIPNDNVNDGEQIAQISKEGWKGYVAAEVEDEIIEIIIDLKKQ